MAQKRLGWKHLVGQNLSLNEKFENDPIFKRLQNAHRIELPPKMKLAFDELDVVHERLRKIGASLRLDDLFRGLTHPEQQAIPNVTGKRSRGRRRKFTEELLSECLALRDSGKSLTIIARRLYNTPQPTNTQRTTVSTILRRYRKKIALRE